MFATKGGVQMLQPVQGLPASAEGESGPLLAGRSEGVPDYDEEEEGVRKTPLPRARALKAAGPGGGVLRSNAPMPALAVAAARAAGGNAGGGGYGDGGLGPGGSIQEGSVSAVRGSVTDRSSLEDSEGVFDSQGHRLAGVSAPEEDSLGGGQGMKRVYSFGPGMHGAPLPPREGRGGVPAVDEEAALRLDSAAQKHRDADRAFAARDGYVVQNGLGLKLAESSDPTVTLANHGLRTTASMRWTGGQGFKPPTTLATKELGIKLLTLETGRHNAPTLPKAKMTSKRANAVIRLKKRGLDPNPASLPPKRPHEVKHDAIRATMNRKRWEQRYEEASRAVHMRAREKTLDAEANLADHSEPELDLHMQSSTFPVPEENAQHVVSEPQGHGESISSLGSDSPVARSEASSVARDVSSAVAAPPGSASSADSINGNDWSPRAIDVRVGAPPSPHGPIQADSATTMGADAATPPLLAVGLSDREVPDDKPGDKAIATSEAVSFRAVAKSPRPPSRPEELAKLVQPTEIARLAKEALERVDRRAVLQGPPAPGSKWLAPSPVLTAGGRAAGNIVDAHPRLMMTPLKQKRVSVDTPPERDDFVGTTSIGFGGVDLTTDRTGASDNGKPRHMHRERGEASKVVEQQIREELESRPRSVRHRLNRTLTKPSAHELWHARATEVLGKEKLVLALARDAPELEEKEASFLNRATTFRIGSRGWTTEFAAVQADDVFDSAVDGDPMQADLTSLGPFVGESASADETHGAAAGLIRALSDCSSAAKKALGTGVLQDDVDRLIATMRHVAACMNSTFADSLSLATATLEQGVNMSQQHADARPALGRGNLSRGRPNPKVAPQRLVADLEAVCANMSTKEKRMNESLTHIIGSIAAAKQRLTAALDRKDAAFVRKRKVNSTIAELEETCKELQQKLDDEQDKCKEVPASISKLKNQLAKTQLLCDHAAARMHPLEEVIADVHAEFERNRREDITLSSVRDKLAAQWAKVQELDQNLSRLAELRETRDNKIHVDSARLEILRHKLSLARQRKAQWRSQLEGLTRSTTPRPDWDAVASEVPQVAEALALWDREKEPIDSFASPAPGTPDDFGSHDEGRTIAGAKALCDTLEQLRVQEAIGIQLEAEEEDIKQLRVRRNRLKHQVDALWSSGGAAAALRRRRKLDAARDHSYFIAMGTSADVPRALRAKTGRKVRHHTIPKVECESIIEAVWEEKHRRDKKQASPCKLDDALYWYLKQKFKDTEAIAEWGYSIFHSFTLYETDPDVRLFVSALIGAVNEYVFQDQSRMLAALEKLLGKTVAAYKTKRRVLIDGNSDADYMVGPGTGMIRVHDCENTLKQFFPRKTEADFAELFDALRRDEAWSTADRIDVRALFVETADRDQGELVTALRLQHLAEAERLVAGVDEGLRHKNEISGSMGRLRLLDIANVLKRVDMELPHQELKKQLARGLGRGARSRKKRKKGAPADSADGGDGAALSDMNLDFRVDCSIWFAKWKEGKLKLTNNWNADAHPVVAIAKTAPSFRFEKAMQAQRAGRKSASPVRSPSPMSKIREQRGGAGSRSPKKRRPNSRGSGRPSTGGSSAIRRRSNAGSPQRHSTPRNRRKSVKEPAA